MDFLWEQNIKLHASEIMEHFSDRNWKLSTVSTFLSRMIEKGVVQSERSGRKFLYYPLVTKKELKRNQAISYIKNNFRSIKDFVLALDDEHISVEEAQKVESILSKIEDYEK